MECPQDEALAMGRWCIRQKLDDLLLVAVHQPSLTTSVLWLFVWIWPVTRHGVILATSSICCCHGIINAEALNTSGSQETARQF